MSTIRHHPDRAVLAAGTILLLLITLVAAAQGTSGVVVSARTAVPVTGATVTDLGRGLVVVTDSLGQFRISATAGDSVRIGVRAVGYVQLDTLLLSRPSGGAAHRVQLQPIPQLLPETKVTSPRPVPPKLTEFEERRSFGQGRFLTDSQLTKNQNRQLSEVIATIPGLRVMRGMGSAGWVAGTRGSGSSRTSGFSPQDMDARKGAPRACYSTVMLDGVYVFTGRFGEALFDVNSLGTFQVAGIEYYAGASTVPLKFRGADTGCGLLVIWTR